MKGIKTTIYTQADHLPDVEEKNFFHCRELFVIATSTPRMKPYMAVCTDESGKPVSQLLALMRYRTSFLPPFFFMHCRIVGEGAYRECEYRRDELFGEMLSAITRRLNNRTLYIEVSNLSQKMFGYRQFRQLGYFHVHWMSIHNSLHSRTPEERITEKMKHRVDLAHSRGVICQSVQSKEDMKAFNNLLHQHHWFKPKRYIPDKQFFINLKDCDRSQLFITKYHDRVIGCSACIYSDQEAYLWYSAFRRKTYLPLHPDAATIWHAIKYAHENKYQHINFLDVGLPFHKNPFREFILKFGGKPVSTFRWFRCSIGWINSFLSWIYRD